MLFDRTTYSLLFEFLFLLPHVSSLPLEHSRSLQEGIAFRGRLHFANSTTDLYRASTAFPTDQRKTTGTRHQLAAPLPTLDHWGDRGGLLFNQTGSILDNGSLPEASTAPVPPASPIHPTLTIADGSQVTLPSIVTVSVEQSPPSPEAVSIRNATSFGIAEPLNHSTFNNARLSPATVLGSHLASANSAAAAAATIAAPTSTNALSVLLDALPSEIRDEVLERFSSDIEPADHSTTVQSTQPSLSITATINASSRPSITPASQPPQRSTIPYTSSTSVTAPTADPVTASTTATSTATNSTPITRDNPSPSNATVAGIATGASAGTILIILALVFLYRRHRRSQGRPAFSPLNPFSSLPPVRSRRTPGAFPELAYLYDPVITPVASRRPSRDRGLEHGSRRYAHSAAAAARARGRLASGSRERADSPASERSPMVVSVEEIEAAWDRSDRRRTPGGGRVEEGRAGLELFGTERSPSLSPLGASLDISGDGRLAFAAEEREAHAR